MQKFHGLSRTILSLDLKVSALVGFVILSMAVGSLLLFKRLADQAQSLLFDAMDAMSYAVHHGLTAQYYERYYDVHAFSKNPAVLAMDRARIESMLNIFVRLYEIYDLILVTDVQGRLVGSSTVNAAGQALPTHLLDPYDFSQEPWFQAIQERRGTFVDSPSVDPYLKIMLGREQRGNSFATAIIDENGQFLGVICIRAGVRWIERELAKAYGMFHAGGFSVARLELIDQQGKLLAQSGVQLPKNHVAEVPAAYPGTAGRAKTAKTWTIQAGNDEDLMFASSRLTDPQIDPSLGWSVRLTVGASTASRQLTHSVRISYALILLASGGILFLAIGYTRRLMISRVLQQQVTARTKELHATARSLEQRNTELERSKAELVETNSQLVAAQKELLDTAKRLGQAEVAALTLHNIGNIITSLNIQGTVLREQMDNDPPGHFALLYLKKIQAEGQNPERMAEFVSRIEAAETATQDSIRNLIRGLIDNVRMAMSAISAQTAFIQQSEQAEAFKLSMLVHHTAGLFEGTFKRDRMRHEIQLQHDAVFLTERFRFESILTVLIRNAIDATADQEDRRIRFYTSCDEHFLTLAMEDNGHGFGPEVAGRLFRFGFTTKAKGHGFGLHFAANSCKHLGLQLKLESPGPGRGATARILIPRDRLLSLTELVNLT